MGAPPDPRPPRPGGHGRPPEDGLRATDRPLASRTPARLGRRTAVRGTAATGRAAGARADPREMARARERPPQLALLPLGRARPAVVARGSRGLSAELLADCAAAQHEQD